MIMINDCIWVVLRRAFIDGLSGLPKGTKSAAMFGNTGSHGGPAQPRWAGHLEF